MVSTSANICDDSPTAATRVPRVNLSPRISYFQIHFLISKHLPVVSDLKGKLKCLAGLLSMRSSELKIESTHPIRHRITDELIQTQHGD